MKSMSGAAVGMAATTSTVSAHENPGEGLRDSEQIDHLLEEVGNPEIVTVEKREFRHHNENSVITTRAETDVGELVYGEFDRPDNRMISSYFKIDSSSSGRILPSKYQSSPGNTEIILVDDQDGNDIQTYRNATKKELQVLAKITEYDEDSISASYHDDKDTFVVTNESEEKVSYIKLVNKTGGKSYLGRSAVGLFNSGGYQIDERSPKDEMSIQDDHCFNLFGPCPRCAVGSVACAGCAGSCVTGPQCALCLVATCGFAGGSCGCCLTCIDNIPDEGNVICG